MAAPPSPPLPPDLAAARLVTAALTAARRGARRVRRRLAAAGVPTAAATRVQGRRAPAFIAIAAVAAAAVVVMMVGGRRFWARHRHHRGTATMAARPSTLRGSGGGGHGVAGGGGGGDGGGGDGVPLSADVAMAVAAAAEARAEAAALLASADAAWLHRVRRLAPPTYEPAYASPCWYQPLPATNLHPDGDDDADGDGNGGASGGGGEGGWATGWMPGVARDASPPPPSTATGDGRRLVCLPTLHLVGAPKAGTTAFAARLGRLHMVMGANRSVGRAGADAGGGDPPPLAVIPPTRKEPRYWDRWAGPTITAAAFAAYTHTFDPLAGHLLAANPRTRQPGWLTYDASIETMAKFNATSPLPAALTSLVPAVRAILLVRDPAERLWSDYLFWPARSLLAADEAAAAAAERAAARPVTATAETVPPPQAGRTAADFHARAVRSVAAFRACTAGGGGALGCTLTPTFRTWEGGGARLAYGAYAPLVALWQAALRPGHLLVLRTEDLDTPAPYRAAAAFLWGDAVGKGAGDAATDPHWRALLGGPHTNVGRQHRRVGPMWPATRRLLTAFYAELNAGLVALTGDPALVWPVADGGVGVAGAPPPPRPPPWPIARRR